MKELFLLRGLPGAGKSTLAKMLVGKKDYCHKEADQYFIDEDGNYKFKAEYLGHAHSWCQEEVEFLMRLEHNVVVSNTFSTEKEMEPYYKLAKKYGYRVHSMIIENRHGGVNSHGCPSETIEKMSERFQFKL